MEEKAGAITGGRCSLGLGVSLHKLPGADCVCAQCLWQPVARQSTTAELAPANATLCTCNDPRQHLRRAVVRALPGSLVASPRTIIPRPIEIRKAAGWG